jgi:hypothetical protein
MVKVPLAACLRHKPRFTDHDIVGHSFAHVVHGQCRHGSTGQSFHLNTGLVMYLATTVNYCLLPRYLDRDLAILKPQRVTKWNQFMGLLGRHDTSDDCRGKHRAFLRRYFVAIEFSNDFSRQ